MRYEITCKLLAYILNKFPKCKEITARVFQESSCGDCSGRVAHADISVSHRRVLQVVEGQGL